jgi:hypothetical protein
MATALIKLTYRHIIDAAAQTDFERNIFHATYQEFRMKSQTYNLNGDLKTFSEMKAKDGRANSMHYKMSFAALHFLIPLNNKIPFLQDAVGNQLNYEQPVFELIESDIRQIKAHRVGIKFTTGTLMLHQVIGNNMILSLEDLLHDDRDFIDTFTLPMQSNLAITSYRDLNKQSAPPIMNTSFKNN